jgi:pentatricopeptide repeat protein
MMMDVLGKYGDMEKARYYFEEMKRNGITPNAVSFSTIINVHLQQQVDGAQEYLDQMRDMGIKIDEVLYTTIITVWAKSGDIKQALRLMDFFFLLLFSAQLPSKDSHIFRRFS